MDLATDLRSRGRRLTMQRRLVLEAVRRARHHVTADEVAKRVRAVAAEVDASTVYRNLEALEELGYITHTHIGRVTKWHRADTEGHGHLVCRSCHQEEEVALEVLDPLARRLRARYGFRADLAHAAIEGLCSRCTASPVRRAAATYAT